LGRFVIGAKMRTFLSGAGADRRLEFCCKIAPLLVKLLLSNQWRRASRWVGTIGAGFRFRLGTRF
jgi:hypothetical protein